MRRWLDEPRFRARATPARPSKLDPYKGYIVRLLEHHRYRAVQIRQRPHEAGYDGGLTIVKDYVRQVRPVRAPAFLTLHFTPGECAQVDWGHYGSVRVGNTRRRLSFFVMVLCYSRMMYVEFTVSQTLEYFLGGHLNAFELGAFSSDYITNLLEARARTLPEPSPLHLTRRANLLDLELPGPDLSLYDSPEGMPDDTPKD